MRPEIRAAVAAICLLLPVPVAAQDAPDTLRESYRDWTLVCAAVAGQDATPARRCEIMQEVRTAETDQRVLRMALVREDDGGAAVALVTPFGVRIADGVGIAAGTAGDSGQARADFVTCLQAGCVATGALDAAMLGALSAAGTATITMQSTSGETVTLEVSLAGFAAAWRRLGVLAPD